MAVLAGLSGSQLLSRVRDLVQRGNVLEADLLIHLGEVDARRLYLEEGRCDSREFLEFDHADAWTWTKSHSIAGISLRCRAHNQLRARRDFGEQHMAKFERRTGFESSSP